MKILPIPGQELELWNRTHIFNCQGTDYRQVVRFLDRLITVPVVSSITLENVKNKFSDLFNPPVLIHLY